MAGDGHVEVGSRLEFSFHRAGEALQAAKSVELCSVGDLGGFECSAQPVDRLVGFQRLGKGMADSVAVGGGEARRVGAVALCAMDDLGDQGKLLQRSRSELFQ